jgi:hypothetical protein
MPSARQLLEQADALMRRNRKRSKGKGSEPPTLTDALGIERTGTLAPTIILGDASPRAADPLEPNAPRGADADARDLQAPAEPIALDTLSDVPVLTDIVDTWPPANAEWPFVADANANALGDALEADALAVTPERAESAEASIVERFVEAIVAPAAEAPAVVTASAAVDPSAHAADEPVDAPDALAADEPAYVADELADDEPVHIADTPTADEPLRLQDEEFILEIPPASDEDVPLDAAGATPLVAAHAVPLLAQGSPEWEAMTEEIRMQVLQRLDLFTDTGMRDQLGARLQPIVARASAELVETINQALGELVRGYVAAAIEREIDTWRKRGG